MGSCWEQSSELATLYCPMVLDEINLSCPGASLTHKIKLSYIKQNIMFSIQFQPQQFQVLPSFFMSLTRTVFVFYLPMASVELKHFNQKSYNYVHCTLYTSYQWIQQRIFQKANRQILDNSRTHVHALTYTTSQNAVGGGVLQISIQTLCRIRCRLQNLRKCLCHSQELERERASKSTYFCGKLF